MPEVSQFRWPRPGSWVSGPVRQFFSSAPDQRSRALARRLGDEVLMGTLDGRVGDLEGVEDIHREVVRQVREDA
jgi:hypothetical protein